MPFGLFNFPFTSSGLQNAIQTNQQFMDDILRHLDFWLPYLDGVIDLPKSPEEDDQDLRTFRTTLSDTNQPH
jgi:hypothetical protein